MFENVIVGVDGRPGGRDAIALAAQLAGESGKVTLVNVHSGRLRPYVAVVPQMVEEEREATEEMLSRERSIAGVDAEILHVEATSPGRGLHQQAEEQGADLIVVGSSNRTPFGRAMLGNDTKAALNGAPCAVAVARAGYAASTSPLAKIGVGYDESRESKAALAAARELAGARKASIEALRVVSIPAYGYAGFAPMLVGTDVEELLKDARERMKDLQGAEVHVVYGLAGEELAAFGDRLDLLVVGSRGYGPLRRLMLGSISDYLASHARCCLLVLPRSAAVEQDAAEPQRDSTGVTA